MALAVREVQQWEPELPTGVPRPRSWRAEGRLRDPSLAGQAAGGFRPPRGGRPFGPWLLPLFFTIALPVVAAVQDLPTITIAAAAGAPRAQDVQCSGRCPGSPFGASGRRCCQSYGHRGSQWCRECWGEDDSAGAVPLERRPLNEIPKNKPISELEHYRREEALLLFAAWLHRERSWSLSDLLGRDASVTSRFLAQYGRAFSLKLDHHYLT